MVIEGTTKSTALKRKDSVGRLALPLSAGLLLSLCGGVASAGEVQPVDGTSQGAVEAFASAAPQLTGDSAVPLREGDGTETVGDSVDVRVPSDPTKPLTLTNATGDAVAVRLPFRDSAEWVRTEGGPVYDNDNDSHTVPVVQQDGSLVIGTVIGSDGAPTEYPYSVSVPSGGSMQMAGEGAVILDAQGALVGGFAPPWAKDANGHPVNTHYEIRGNDLVQVVDHRVDGVVYPVTADPWLGIDLFDWTSRTDCPGGGAHCEKGKSGYVISAGLSKWAMYWRYTGSGYGILNGSGWEELVNKRPAADNYNNRMRPQWTCHAIGAYPPLTGGDSWDIESWRPENWSWSVWVNKRCNW